MHVSAKFLPVFALILANLSTPAFAKEKSKANLDQVESPLSVLYECSKIESSEDRLACFDKTVASLKTAEEKKELVAIDAESAKKLKKEAFGFNLPSLPKLGLPSLGIAKDKEEALVVGVDSISRGRGGTIFRLENGQIWQQSSGSFNYIPKGDLVATIKPASMGSYMISLNNGKTKVRGMRVRRLE